MRINTMTYIMNLYSVLGVISYDVYYYIICSVY